MLKATLLAATALLASAGVVRAQSVVNLVHPAPTGAIIGFVLTDGTVLVQGGNETDFWKLTPDSSGSYVKGTWTQMASLPTNFKYSPDAGSSSMLANGKLLFIGGEYNFNVFTLTDICTIYDPVANSWTRFNPPTGWHFIGDSPSSILADGNYLVGDKIDHSDAVLNPSTMTWSALAHTGKADFNAEEGWTLLPNGTILTADVKDGPNTEIYDPTAQKWTSAGPTPVPLNGPPEAGPIHYGKNKIYHPPGEIGPAILRPDGTVFATGATPRGGQFGHTAIYTPGANGGIGTWTKGPDFPSGEDAGDSFASLLPTGNVLVESESGRLYEFDGKNLTQTQFATGGLTLVLPSGEILLNGNAVYRAKGTVNPAWAPTISSVPTTLTPGNTYEVQGTQFNGLSQANSFGDEFQTNTNYPLVRITNTASGQVFYARTHDHSSMGVATGSTPESTNFDVPSNAPSGASTLVVVANGIASTPVNVTIQ